MATVNPNVDLQAPVWGRALISTFPNFVEKMSDQTIEETALLNRLMSKGRIRFNQGGTQINWNIKVDKRSFDTRQELDTVAYSRKLLHRQANLQWTEYIKTDAIGEMEGLMNRGGEQIFAVANRLLNDMRVETVDQLTEELYNDGAASGNSSAIQGINTWFQESGTVTADEFGTAAGTFGSLGIGLGDLGGTTSTDPAFDAFSPVLVNVGNIGSGITAVTSSQGEAPILVGIRKGITHTRHGASRARQVDLGIIGRSAYDTLRNNLQAEERIIAARKDSINAGFVSVNFDGVDFIPDPALAGTVNSGLGGDNAFFLLNTDEIEFHVMTSQLFEANSWWDFYKLAWVYRLSFYGQLMTNSPRNHAKGYDIAGP